MNNILNLCVVVFSVFDKNQPPRFTLLSLPAICLAQCYRVNYKVIKIV